jgi:predicted kinase
MPIVYILIGVQGAGKSAWARLNAERLNAAILASDEMRNELEAQGIDAATEGDRVFAMVEQRLGQLVDSDRNVIVDATHARRRWRAKHLGIARKHGARTVAVWFDLPRAVCLARNAAKPGGLRWGERVVPEAILRDVARGFEPPSDGEFDEVWRMTVEGSVTTI